MTVPESTQELSPHASDDESAVPDEAAPARGARRLRWLVWLVAGVVLVGVAGVAWWVGSSAQSPDQAAARASEPVASWVTAPVKFEVLSATVIQRGDVHAEVTVDVGVPASVEGDAVVTRVVVGAGDEIADGDRVVEVSGRPVFAMAGDVPVYRALRPGMSGADVTQLQDALVRLGFDADTDGVFGEATKSAVAAMYEQAGYDTIPVSPTAAADIAAGEQSVLAAESTVRGAQEAVTAAGTSSSAVAQAQATKDQAARAVDDAKAARVEQVRLGEAEYNSAVRNRDRLAGDPATPPAELEAAELQVQQVGAQLEQTRRTTADAVDTANEALWVAAVTYDELVAGDPAGGAQADLDAAVAARDQAQATLDELRASNGPTVPQGEIVFVPSMPARVLAAATTTGPVNSPTADPGAGGPAGSGALVDLAAGQLVVSTTIRPGDIGLARVGLPVELLDETTSTVYPATISDLATEPTTGTDGQAGYPATITTDNPLPDSLTGANLRVTLTAASTDTEVLVVPLAAVSTSADGTSRVTVVSGPNDAEGVDVAVVAGISADGFVAVEPVDEDALVEGDLVVIGT